MAAVARRLGVAPPTLRTWARRYGLGPSAHTAGAHRRYTAVDVYRLEMMRRLTLDGVSPVDAARVARQAEVDAEKVTPLAPWPAGQPAASARPEGTMRAERGAGGLPAPPAHPEPAGRGGGGRIIPMPAGTPAARGLARAAMSLDGPAATAIISTHLDRFGVVVTWESLLVPVLVGVGARYEATGEAVDVEHLLSESVMSALRGVTTRLRSPVNVRPALLACTKDELHSLPLHAIAAALAERHIGSRVLGARVPVAALASAARRSGPGAIFLWAQREDTADVAALRRLPPMRPAPAVVVGGPGWNVDELPPGVAHMIALPEAVERLDAALRGS